MRRGLRIPSKLTFAVVATVGMTGCVPSCSEDQYCNGQVCVEADAGAAIPDGAVVTGTEVLDSGTCVHYGLHLGPNDNPPSGCELVPT
jgi:hypothetical protein